MKKNTTLSVLLILILFQTPAVFGAVEISDGSVKGLWHLDGDSVDSSGNGYNGADTSMTYGNNFGNLSESGIFDGTNSFIELGDILDPTTNTFWISFWYKRDLASGVHGIITKTDDASARSYYCYQSTTDLYCGMSGNGSSGNRLDQYYAISDTSMHHYFIIFNPSAPSLTWYKDGASISPTTSVNTFSGGSVYNSATKLFFGQRSGATWRMDGDLNEVAIAYGTATSGLPLALYNGGNGSTICVSVGCGASPTSSQSTSTLTQTDAINIADFFVDIFALLIAVGLLLLRR